VLVPGSRHAKRVQMSQQAGCDAAVCEGPLITWAPGPGKGAQVIRTAVGLRRLSLLSMLTAVAVVLVFMPGSLTARAASAGFGTCNDPRDAIFCSSLVSGQLGAWDMDGGAPITNPTVHHRISYGLGLNVVRYQMWRQPCALSTADTSTPGVTCVTTTEFAGVISGIRDMGAEPLIDLPPIVNTCEYAAGGGPGCNNSGSVNDNNQCPGGPSDQAESLAWDEWIIAHAGSRAELYELGNEPDNYCGMSTSGYYSLWSSTVPALKSYARNLTTGGCPCTIFMGGPAWTNSDSSARTAVDTFLADTLSGYSGHSGNIDYIPDFISTHTYLTSAQNDTRAHATAAIGAWGAVYDELQADIASTFSGVTLDGIAASAYIKVADTEYNDTIDPHSSINTSQAWCNFYYNAMFSMFNGHGLWIDNQFTLAASGNGALNLEDPTTAAKEPCFSSFASHT
jgi:hypothetical protein